MLGMNYQVNKFYNFINNLLNNFQNDLGKLHKLYYYKVYIISCLSNLLIYKINIFVKNHKLSNHYYKIINNCRFYLHILHIWYYHISHITHHFLRNNHHYMIYKFNLVYRFYRFNHILNHNFHHCLYR